MASLLDAPLRQVIQDRKAAVVVVDMQNDFCDPDGATARFFHADVSLNQAVAGPINEFLDKARAAGVPVVHLKTETTEETSGQATRNKIAQFQFFGMAGFGLTSMCGQGSWGAEFWGVEPQGDELVVTKHSYSGFAETRLNLVLRAMGIETVILCGVTANVCVESTARDAVFNDYNVVVVRDLVGWLTSDATMAEATFASLAIYFGLVCTSDDVVGVWQDRPKPADAALVSA